ncbi:MAG: hypothetical protein O9312_04645 [Hylemonella sp.]|nr:hypothetical protein [Hylemonella sp.]
MHPLLSTVKREELEFIATLDYGQSADEHFAALKSLVFERECNFKDGEYWYPYEVIELGSNSVQPGREREFVICCLLVLEAIKRGFDPAHDRESKFSAIEPMLSELPNEMATLLVEAYAADR